MDFLEVRFLRNRRQFFQTMVSKSRPVSRLDLRAKGGTHGQDFHPRIPSRLRCGIHETKNLFLRQRSQQTLGRLARHLDAFCDL